MKNFKYTIKSGSWKLEFKKVECESAYSSLIRLEVRLTCNNRVKLDRTYHIRMDSIKSAKYPTTFKDVITDITNFNEALFVHTSIMHLISEVVTGHRSLENSDNGNNSVLGEAVL